MKAFAQTLVTTVPTNRYARNITDSRNHKESGGTSRINDAEAAATIIDLKQVANNPVFIGKTITIMSFYKGQIAFQAVGQQT